jgi:hypothetical protein
MPEYTPRLAQLILDLGSLLSDLQRLSLGNKPWTRQLQLHLQAAQGSMDLLRVAIAMERPTPELLDAAKAVQLDLRRADDGLNRTRAEVITKAAVRLGLGQAAQLVKLLASD